MKKGPRTVLVIKPSSFGDVLHAISSVALLKAAWPDARLTWVINPEWAPLLSGNPSIDEVLLFPRREFRGWGALVRFRRWYRQALSSRRPELAIDLQGLLRSAWIGRASHPDRFVGMSDAREGARWLYDHLAPVGGKTTHAIDRCLATTNYALSLFGVEANLPPRSGMLSLLPSGAPLDSERDLPDDFILLHPFARGQGKSLTVADTQRICERVAPRRVIVVGKKRDATNHQLPENAVNLLNKTSLEQLIWLIRKAAFVVTVDSGPSHLAAALQRPMIAIHTWSDPRQVGPHWNKAWIWKNGHLLRVEELAALGEKFLSGSAWSLTQKDIDRICDLVTSP